MVILRREALPQLSGDARFKDDKAGLALNHDRPGLLSPPRRIREFTDLCRSTGCHSRVLWRQAFGISEVC